MSNLLYIVAVVLLILWAFGFYAMDLGNVVHILLFIAFVAILLRLIRGRRV
ncbi:MAG: lmo0937 family membrane protein [Bacteroidales bacterium]|nr:lmo0937 family membrane protein [Bacteroidales bacterium]